MIKEPAKYLRKYFKNRGSYLIKFLGISAAAAITIKLFYSQSTLASTLSTVSQSPQNLQKSSTKNVEHQNSSSKTKQEKLISVHMFSRHGARTPLHLISGLEQAEYKSELLEPYVKAKYKLRDFDNNDFDEHSISIYDQRNIKANLKGGIGRGQLTKVGEKQMFELGRLVREKYVNKLKFLDPEYDPNQIYVRSTHFRRTINSAKSVLAGIYAKSPEDTSTGPFQINVHGLKEDYLFPNALGCSYFAEMYKFLEKLDLFTKKEYLENLKELREALENLYQTSNINFTSFRDDLSARKVHGLPVPKELEDLLNKSDRYASMELTSTSRHKPKIAVGRLLNLIRENLQETVKQNSNGKNKNLDFHKFRYYSAHDSTLNAILVAFDLIDDDNEKWPPFAADIKMELWKEVDDEKQNNNNNNKQDHYFVRFFYCDKLLSPPKCKGTKCKFDDFIKILEKHGADKHEYDKLCAEKFNP